jgi:ferric-dicitrate binding protein FerR (iron transport regulator)
VKRSDLTAYIDGELDKNAAAVVEAELYDNPDYLEAVADLCRDRFLLAEHYADQIAQVEANEAAVRELPSQVRRPRRIRSWPMPATIAVVVAIGSLYAMQAVDIGGINRAAGAVLHGGFLVDRSGQLQTVADHAVLFTDVWAATKDQPAEVRFPEAPEDKVVLKPNSRARFYREAKERRIQLIEGSTTIEVKAHDPKRPLVVKTPACEARIKTPEAKFDLAVIDYSYRLNLHTGELVFTPHGARDSFLKARRHIHGLGDGKTHNVGRKHGKTTYRVVDPTSQAPLPLCEDLRHNNRIALSFERQRPIAVAVDFKKKLQSVHFDLAYQAPGEKKFSDIDPKTFRANGDKVDPDPPYYFFGGNKTPTAWTPDKPGIYRLRAMPVNPGKGQKPIGKEQAIIFLHYKQAPVEEPDADAKKK